MDRANFIAVLSNKGVVVTKDSIGHAITMSQDGETYLLDVDGLYKINETEVKPYEYGVLSDEDKTLATVLDELNSLLETSTCVTKRLSSSINVYFIPNTRQVQLDSDGKVINFGMKVKIADQLYITISPDFNNEDIDYTLNYMDLHDNKLKILQEYKKQVK